MLTEPEETREADIPNRDPKSRTVFVQISQKSRLCRGQSVRFGTLKGRIVVQIPDCRDDQFASRFDGAGLGCSFDHEFFECGAVG